MHADVVIDGAPLEEGDEVRVWLPDPALPRGGSFWHGLVTGESWPDGTIGVMLRGVGAVAKVFPDACFA